MPSGWENDCEYETFFEDNRQLLEKKLVTREEVLHAETNAIAKLARDGQSSQDATTVYITLVTMYGMRKTNTSVWYYKRLVYIRRLSERRAGLDFLYKTANS
jgi:hypothetical protein